MLKMIAFFFLLLMIYLFVLVNCSFFLMCGFGALQIYFNEILDEVIEKLVMRGVLSFFIDR